MPATRTILTVDDSRTMREMLHAALTEMGYRVVQAEDGVEGLERLRDERPDVIITDYTMPRLDGPGFIAAVREDPEQRGTPILVLTTEMDPAQKERARRAGATGWIQKPFEPGRLGEALRRVMV